MQRKELFIKQRKELFIKQRKELFIKPNDIDRTVQNHLDHINRAFESKARLGIMSALIVNESVDFVTLKESLDMTDGNLASHIRALETAGYIASRKQFVGKRPNTAFSVTGAGRQAFMDHIDALELFLRSNSLQMSGDDSVSW